LMAIDHKMSIVSAIKSKFTTRFLKIVNIWFYNKLLQDFREVPI
jgi:hypothetical protein